MYVTTGAKRYLFNLELIKYYTDRSHVTYTTKTLETWYIRSSSF